MKYLILLFPFIFTSCYFKEFEGVKRHVIHERIFENSASGRIISKKVEIADTKIIYLSDIVSKIGDYDTFLFSIYIFDKEDSLETIKYDLTINGITPIKIQKLDREADIVNIARISNPWYHNYLLYFKKSDTAVFDIRFRYFPFGEITTTLIKGRGDIRDYPSLISLSF